MLVATSLNRVLPSPMYKWICEFQTSGAYKLEIESLSESHRGRFSVTVAKFGSYTRAELS
jgi:hypothetical protein